MKITNKDIELFDLLSRNSDSTVDKYSLFVGHEFENKRQQYEESFITLSALKLIYIKNEGRQVIIKTTDFQDAIYQGGLNKFVENKEKQEKLNNDLMESNLKTDKYSRRTMLISIFIGILTLIALIVQIILD